MEGGRRDPAVGQGAPVAGRHHDQRFAPAGAAFIFRGLYEDAGPGVAEQRDAAVEFAEPGEDAGVGELLRFRPGAAGVGRTGEIHRRDLFAGTAVPGGAQKPDHGTIRHEFDVAVAESAAPVRIAFPIRLVLHVAVQAEGVAVVVRTEQFGGVVGRIEPGFRVDVTFAGKDGHPDRPVRSDPRIAAGEERLQRQHPLVFMDDPCEARPVEGDMFLDRFDFARRDAESEPLRF